jgi:predicted TIM-barrel fold metal-dependent hydrolase
VPVVDVHAHVFPVAGRAIEGALSGWRGDASAPALLRVMDAVGVSRAILVPFGRDPAHVLECRRRFDDRFGALTLDSTAQSTLAADRGRCDGMRLNWLGAPGATRLADLETAPLLQSLADAGLTLSFFGDREQLANLEVVLREIPQLSVLINHLGAVLENFSVDDAGRPSLRDAPQPQPDRSLVQRYAAYPAVAVAVSGLYALSRRPYPYLDLRPTVERIAAWYGPQRLLWGSDFPWINADPGYRETLNLIDHQLPGLSGTERAAVLGGNARRLFGASERAAPDVTGTVVSSEMSH